SHPSPTAAVSARGSVFFSCGGRRSPRALPAWQQRPMDLPRARPEAPGDGARLQAFTLVRRGDAEALELLLSTVEPSVWGAWRDFAGATLYQVAEDSAGRRGGGAARCLELLGARLRALGFEEVRRPRVPYRDVVEEVPAVGVERGLDVGVPEVQFHKTLRHHGAPKGEVERRACRLWRCRSTPSLRRARRGALSEGFLCGATAVRDPKRPAKERCRGAAELAEPVAGMRGAAELSRRGITPVGPPHLC
ncbi:unnamed protein product, partial [Prorocentrum cordatum]